MSSVTESNLGLNYGWAYGESGWNTGMDDNLVKLGFTSRNQVKGILSAPPSTPSNGDAYIVGTAPTGLFSGKFANIAIYDRGSWVFITPKSQEVVFNAQNGCEYLYDNGWSFKLEEEKSPYIKVKDFTFSTGYTITDQRQCLLNIADNKYYQWTGSLPIVVPAGSTPTPLGSGGWINRTDSSLRSELTASGSTIAQIASMRSELTSSGSTTTQVGALRTDLAAFSSSVSIAGVSAANVAEAANYVRTATFVSGTTVNVTAAQLGSSLIMVSATSVVMPTLASLAGLTGHFHIRAGNQPLTLTISGGASFYVLGVAVTSLSVPAGSDIYIAYSAVSDIYAYGVATLEPVVKSYCLVNATGTGALNELVSAALPANVAINTRYVLANPFGVNVPVSGWAEIYYNNRWANAGFIFDTGAPMGGYGVAMDYVQGEGIIIQTGSKSVVVLSSFAGGGHGATANVVIASAPARVFIQKLGA